MNARLIALALALCVAGGVGVVSVRRVTDQLDVLAACRAADSGNWGEALARTEGRVGSDETGRSAAECRCAALLANDLGERCVGMLEELLSDPSSGDWAPRPQLSVHLIQTWRDAGRSREAAELARRAAHLHPHDPDLFYLELTTRSESEDEGALLRELRKRVAGLDAPGSATARMRVTLANRHLLRADPAAALEVLGEAPPDGAAAAETGLWFETRGMAFASAGDLAGVRRTYGAWRRAGGRPIELRARYALTLSIAGLADPDRKPVELLRAALVDAIELPPDLEERLVIRLVLTLVTAGKQKEALALFDEASQRFALEGLRREELLRSAAHRELAALPEAERRGEILFRITAPLPGSELWVSPEPGAPPDTDFERIAVPPSGRVRVERSFGTSPQRWVYLDAAGRPMASGTESPVARSRVTVDIEPSLAERVPTASLSRQPADGRRRVLLILLDCADWRISQYLRARGELPVLSALIESGYRAVLESDPPLTAAALEALLWPGRRGDLSFVGLVHQFGTELAGLADVGENPFDPLAWILPEDEDLFSTFGAGDLSAANLLFAHGGRRAGRHSEVTGPSGARRRVPLTKSARDLSVDERHRYPALAAALSGRDGIHLRTIAGELDVAEEIARAGEIDFLALRVEPLDIVTHGNFAEAVRNRQDDGEGLLFSVYRYLDERLGRLHDLLDEDDVFVVMSDHGIRTAMEHSKDAMFVAVGPGIEPGRAPGRPNLRGVPAVLAGYLGVEVDWDDAGLAPSRAFAER